MSTWIKVVGEPEHNCDLPWSLENSIHMGSIHLQGRHAGSIWQCDCNRIYIWNGRVWMLDRSE